MTLIFFDDFDLLRWLWSFAMTLIFCDDCDLFWWLWSFSMTNWISPLSQWLTAIFSNDEWQSFAYVAANKNFNLSKSSNLLAQFVSLDDQRVPLILKHVQFHLQDLQLVVALLILGLGIGVNWQLTILRGIDLLRWPTPISRDNQLQSLAIINSNLSR